MSASLNHLVDGSRVTREEKKVLAATLVGTGIEWYDYFIYAQAAALVFASIFFIPFSKDRPDLVQILSLATIGVAFLFRPLGAVTCGYLGDRFGRKVVLAATLILMGSATVLVGLLPDYSQIGIWAPILLIILRVVQGFSAGGEWGGAALLAVEHAPRTRRTLFGCFPQIGVPIGLILATLVLLCVTSVMSKQAFLTYGWRIPFLLSIILIIVGSFVRRSVEESPVFALMHRRRKESAAPLRQLFAQNTREVILASLVFVGTSAAGYLVLAFFIGYGQTVLHLQARQLLTASTLAAATWLVSTLVSGFMGDKLGQVRTIQIGYVLLALWAIPMWFLIDTGNVYLLTVSMMLLTVPIGLTYGPQAALYADMFPAKVRYSGVSMASAAGSILGGAFAPSIAQWILSISGHSWLVGAYLVVLSIISLVAVSMIGRQSQLDLDNG
jgi:MFS family permease